MLLCWYLVFTKAIFLVDFEPSHPMHVYNVGRRYGLGLPRCQIPISLGKKLVDSGMTYNLRATARGLLSNYCNLGKVQESLLPLTGKVNKGLMEEDLCTLVKCDAARVRLYSLKKSRGNRGKVPSDYKNQKFIFHESSRESLHFHFKVWPFR